MSCSLLLVEDHAFLRRSLARALILAAHLVFEADSGEAAMELLSSRNFEVVISDLRLPGKINGLDVLRQQRRDSTRTRLILMTAFGSADAQEEAAALGMKYIEKPFSIQDLLSLL